MKYITAVPASAGLAVGTVRYLRHTQSGLGRAVRSPKEEQEAFENAVREAQDQLIRLSGALPHRTGIFLWCRGCCWRTRGLGRRWRPRTGWAAVRRHRGARGGHFAGRIRALEDPYMRERALRYPDACRRVVKVLDGQPHETLRLTGPAILVAEELYPTDIVTLDRSLVLGFITSAGSPNAHAAIIARTMGIPAAVMAGPELLEGCDGRTLALNGDTGEAYLDPDEATKTRFAHKLRLQRRHTLSQERLRAAPCTTKTARASR
ncbi:MAG: PEP-utilizing enzyme [Ruthenibacterium lactatiformans]